ncbi:cytidine deaminase [Carboxydochorda subterranea]|uniref:Cytidine deaminase n=1 Tax=Carboxydichorda subterranea TaxID=3109565 RepID=A0ABZ1C0H5_9FIRM|nr:cytidine deaminase [Limnochorda sp. L945t]WRP18286.1 cytidine deaminase [Limnochorda sp. L945t]
MTPEQEEALVRRAWEVRERAYAPYSGFRVGAALLTGDGQIFTGCNVENAVYGATLCAERTAVGQAVAAGQRDLVAIAVVAATDALTTPCGICRQVLAEFGPRMAVVVDNGKERRRYGLDELLPDAFSRSHLEDAAGRQVSFTGP